MGLEDLTKDELIKQLEQKKLTLELLSEKNEKASAADFITPEFIRALVRGRCRLCVGRTITQVDPNNPRKRNTIPIGQPYVISTYVTVDNEGNEHVHEYGNEKSCRTCQHVRNFLLANGVRGIYDKGPEAND